AYALLWSSGLRDPVPYVIVGVANGVVGGFHFPAWQAFVSELVPRELLLNAVTLNSAQFNAARAFGPAVGGVVLALGGPAWSFGLNAVSFGASLLAVWMIEARPAARAEAGPRSSALADILDALGYLRRSPGLRRVLLVAALTSSLGQPLIYLVVVFADDVFRVGELQYGMLTASMGIGAVLATPLVAGWGTSLPRSVLVGLGASLYGGAVLGFGLAPVYWVGVVFLLLVGAAHLTSASTMNTVMQLQAAEHMRAKMLSFYLMVITAGMPIGSLVQGTLADVIGPRQTVAGAGVVLLTVSIFLSLSGRLRTIEG
ncbi:MAG: MFS transporter, partial [Acidimicrobiales bacterium]|nr:MFS transporter [Acidimicrobiales bacterium]